MGNRVSILGLGRYDSLRLNYYFYNSHKLRDSDLVQKLIDETVIKLDDGSNIDRETGKIAYTHALNFVSVWHPTYSLIAVILPTIFGSIVCIVWPAVATRSYGADLQSSIQTGFAIGGYIVTAGALVVALVTFATVSFDTATQEPKGKILSIFKKKRLKR